MKKKIISTDKAPSSVGAYSQCVEYNDVLYFSGQIGISPQDNQLKVGFELQLEQILKNIDAILESQNLKRENIIKTTVFLTDLGYFEKVSEAYVQYFEKPYPARSCVEVSALPKGALVEIEVLAGK